MGYGPAQDRVIATSLLKFEALKPLYRHQKRYGDSLAVANQGLHRTIGFQRTALVQADSIIVTKDVLYLDRQAKAAVWEKKAKARWWGNVALSALVVLVSVVALR